MWNWVRSHISVKLFLSYFIVIFVYTLVLSVAVDLVIPGFFNRHMQTMGPGMSSMMTRPQGGMMTDLLDSVRAVLLQSLLFGLGVAGLFATLASAWFSRRLVAPLRSMMQASERIAGGHFNERVQTADPPDELGQLAARFNQMAETLQHTESMRTRLIGDVSHELRTPLSAIKGTMEALEDGVLPANAATFQQVQREAMRLERLVDDLQELSRVEAGAYNLQTTVYDLVTLVRDTMEPLRPGFAAGRVAVQLDEHSAPLFVLADPDRTAQVLVNLLANARQYTPPGGSVTVAVRQVDGCARVSVRDSGAGIPPEHLERIFTRFYRIDQSRARTYGGSGIGLTIARHLVEAQGGSIWAESAGEGQGSLFTFTLPLAGKGKLPAEE